MGSVLGAMSAHSRTTVPIIERALCRFLCGDTRRQASLRVTAICDSGILRSPPLHESERRDSGTWLLPTAPHPRPRFCRKYSHLFGQQPLDLMFQAPIIPAAPEEAPPGFPEGHMLTPLDPGAMRAAPQHPTQPTEAGRAVGGRGGAGNTAS